jgi:hypothetical protein
MPGLLVKKVRVMIFLTELVLFGTAVMVKSKQQLASPLTGTTKKDRRLATVRTHLETGTQTGTVECQTIEPLPFAPFEKALHLFGIYG